MPDKERVLEMVSAMPEGIEYREIAQALNIWFSDQQAEADIKAGRFYPTYEAKQRVREMASV